jgi:hypothetical protein
VVAGLLYLSIVGDFVDYVKFLSKEPRLISLTQTLFEGVGLAGMCCLCFCPNSLLLKHRFVTYTSLFFMVLYGIFLLALIVPFEGPIHTIVAVVLVSSPVLSLAAAWVALSGHSGTPGAAHKADL